MPDTEYLHDTHNRKAYSAILGLAVAGTTIFLLALGSRLLYWQDAHAEIEQLQILSMTFTKPYQREVKRIVESGGILFPSEFIDPKDARMIVHPPGYSILVAAIYGSESPDDSYARMRLVQVFCDAAAAVILFLIAAELLPFGIAIIAGAIVALSPHLSYYSLWLSPDSLAVLPILIAIYFIIRASKQPRYINIMAAGLFIGLSCWLRSNALLLAPFLALAILLLFERGKRWRYSAVLIASTVVVIAPITIRNWMVYHRFVPLSLGAGITLIEGIADYDREGRFGMPATDKEVARKDAEWHNRPDYTGNIWTPDGVERDRYRFSRGLSVARSNPGWFLGVVFRRMAFMLRYNDTGSHDWPFNTAMAPIVSSEPTFSHEIRAFEGAVPMWSNSPADWVTTGKVTSPQTEVTLADDGQLLLVMGDNSEFGDQFISAPINVEGNSDYVLALPVRLEQGAMAVKVVSADGRMALASEIVPETRAMRNPKKKAKRGVKEGLADEQKMAVIHLAFASGDRTEVRLVISNNGESSVRPVLQVGQAEMVLYGPTSYRWTRYPRTIIRGLQKNIFKTKYMLPLIIIGIALTTLARRWRALAILLAVPIHYLCIQSALHTEYRYILAIHYFLFVMAAVTFYCGGVAIGQSLVWVKGRIVRGCRGAETAE